MNDKKNLHNTSVNDKRCFFLLKVWDNLKSVVFLLLIHWFMMYSGGMKSTYLNFQLGIKEKWHDLRIILISSYEQWEMLDYSSDKILLPYQAHSLRKKQRKPLSRVWRIFMWIMVLLCHVELHRLKPKTTCMLQLFVPMAISFIACTFFSFFSSCFFSPELITNASSPTTTKSHTLKCINSLKYLFIQTNKKMRGKNRKKKHELKLCSFETKTKNRGIESFLTWNCKTVNFKLSVYLLQP